MGLILRWLSMPAMNYRDYDVIYVARVFRRQPKCQPLDHPYLLSASENRVWHRLAKEADFR
jgi:hypothetical protein